jgi:dopamine beta-monooxygenase
VIQPGNEALVHHMEVFHCEAPHTQMMPEYHGPCFSVERPEVTKVCKRVLAAWAMGALPFSYPEVQNYSLHCFYAVTQKSVVSADITKRLALFQEAGLPIGGPDFNPYVMLEVHYNNPERRTGE